MFMHVCLLLCIVDDLVCRVRLTHRKLDHRFLWNISSSFTVLDEIGHIISRIVAQGFNRLVLTMGNGIVSTPCTSTLCVH